MQHPSSLGLIRVWSGFLINNSESFQSVPLLCFHMDTPSRRSPISSDTNIYTHKIRELVASSEELVRSIWRRLIQRLHASINQNRHIFVYFRIYVNDINAPALVVLSNFFLLQRTTAWFQEKKNCLCWDALSYSSLHNTWWGCWHCSAPTDQCGAARWGAGVSKHQ